MKTQINGSKVKDIIQSTTPFVLRYEHPYNYDVDISPYLSHDRGHSHNNGKFQHLAKNLKK